MAYWYHHPHYPEKLIEPREFSETELDTLKIYNGKRDSCKHHLGEYKQCTNVVKQNFNPLLWKRKLKSNCLFYYDHWTACRAELHTKLGLSNSFF